MIAKAKPEADDQEQQHVRQQPRKRDFEELWQTQVTDNRIAQLALALFPAGFRLYPFKARPSSGGRPGGDEKVQKTDEEKGNDCANHKLRLERPAIWKAWIKVGQEKQEHSGHNRAMQQSIPRHRVAERFASRRPTRRSPPFRDRGSGRDRAMRARPRA